MHRYLMKNQLKDGFEVDHIDGNPLNNQKLNLRIVTRQQNTFNQRNKGISSKYKGVCWHKKSKKWQSKIYINNTQVHLGIFVNETEAALAYNKAALELFGEYAKLNEIEGKSA